MAEIAAKPRGVPEVCDLSGGAGAVREGRGHRGPETTDGGEPALAGLRHGEVSGAGESADLTRQQLIGPCIAERETSR